MNCCDKKVEKKGKGFLKGILYGLAPHTFCILFIILSVLGVTTATTLLKPLLLNPYFFYILIALSIVFATIAAIFYFKQQGFITLSKTHKGLELNFLPAGIKRKWKYLLTLYGTTVSINLLLFMVIFPITANINSGSTLTAAVIGTFGGGGELKLSESGSLIRLQVAIPCPGHAPLIIGELKKIAGVENVKFRFPNLFDVGYDPEKTSKEKMLSLDVFKTYKATAVDETTNSEISPQNNPDSLTDFEQPPSNIGGLGSGCAAGCGGSGGGCGCGCGAR